MVPPGGEECVRQVEAEVDESSTGRSQVGLAEERADQKALHDGCSGKRHEEKEDDSWIAIWQYVTPLKKKGKDNQRNCYMQ